MFQKSTTKPFIKIDLLWPLTSFGLFFNVSNFYFFLVFLKCNVCAHIVLCFQSVKELLYIYYYSRKTIISKVFEGHSEKNVFVYYKREKLQYSLKRNKYYRKIVIKHCTQKNIDCLKSKIALWCKHIKVDNTSFIIIKIIRKVYFQYQYHYIKC